MFAENEDLSKTAPSSAIVPQQPDDPKNMLAKEAKDKLVIITIKGDN